MHNYFFIACITLFGNKAFSQLSVSGQVLNEASQPIAAANITLLKKNKKAIVAFGITNAKGEFKITYANYNAADTFFIKVNAVGFSVTEKEVNSTNQHFTFTLTPTSIKLPDVIVKAGKPALKYKADTLTYAVDSFTQKQDRTIGDVLKKMPGIDVDANGRISYNGQAISNFYIDGDDLMADKYNIATNSIGADMVKDVQVLENHQPIKALKNAAYSDKVALNLNLKEKARLKVSAKIEGGLGYANNLLYDATANIMAFKKTYKAINSFKANNTGVDLSQDIISHNLSDYLKTIQNNVPTDMLGLNTPGNPNINRERYLFNNAALANANNLFKSRKGIQSRVNVYYLYDKQIQNFTNNNFFYLPTDTIKYLQQQNTQQKTNNLQLKYALNSNTEKAYWNNILLLSYNKLPAFSITTLNAVATTQELLQKTTAISNEFNYIKTKQKKNVIEWYSYFSYLTKPELLQVAPGINETLFNAGNNYLQLQQHINVPTYFTNTYVDYRVPKQKFLQSYRVGFTSQWQQLQSQINAKQLNNTTTSAGSNFVNDVNWNYQKTYAKTEFDYLGERTKVTLSLPFSWHHLQYTSNNNLAKTTTNFNQLFINPFIGIKHAVGLESYITARYSFGNEIATIQDVYGNAVLLNHNLLYTNAVAVRQKDINSFALGYNYRKSIKILFINASASYSKSNNNSIVNTSFFSNMQQQQLIGFDNKVTNFMANVGYSKFLFKLKTTINLKANFRQMEFTQIQNNLANDFINTTYGFNTKITPKINNKITATYNGSITFSNGKLKHGNKNLQSVILMQHEAELNLFPTNDLQFTLKAEDFYIKQVQQNQTNNYFFADASVLYKLNKYKADLVFEVQNLANTFLYTTANVSSNSLSQNAFNIRPRMFFAKLLFNL